MVPEQTSGFLEQELRQYLLSQSEHRSKNALITSEWALEHGRDRPEYRQLHAKIERCAMNRSSFPAGLIRSWPLLALLLTAAVWFHRTPYSASNLEVPPDTVEYALAPLQFLETGHYEIIVEDRGLPPRYPLGWLDRVGSCVAYFPGRRNAGLEATPYGRAWPFSGIIFLVPTLFRSHHCAYSGLPSSLFLPG